MPHNRSAILSRRTTTTALILSCQRRRSRRQEIDILALQDRLNRLLDNAAPGSENDHPDTCAGICAALDWVLKTAR